MGKVFKFLVVLVSVGFICSGLAYAVETIDVTRTITVGATVGEVKTLNVTANNVSDDLAAAGVQFDLAAVTPANPWTVAKQYLKIQYNCNLANWAIRILSDNKTAYAGMAGKPTAPGVDGVYGTADDILSYAGLIDSATKANPENRASLAWQVYANKPAPYVASLVDNDLKGLTAAGAPTDAYNWNSKWAYVADKSDTGYAAGVNNNTGYFMIGVGGPTGLGLSFHPATGANPTQPTGVNGDGDIVVPLAARFGGLGAGTYGTNLMVQLVHE
jgi:hypothetical protein